MIHSTKSARDNPIIKIRKFFDKIGPQRLLRPLRIVEADEVVEAVEVLMPGKSLMWTSESSRHLNLAFFYVLKKKMR